MEESPWFKRDRVDCTNPDRTVDVLLAVLLADDGIDGDCGGCDDDHDGQVGDGGHDNYARNRGDEIRMILTFARKHLLLKKLTTSFVSTW